MENKNSQESKMLTEKEKQKLKDELTTFLCLKFRFSGIELIKEIENNDWRKKFTDWKAIKEVLVPKGKPTFRNWTKKFDGVHDMITIILPNNNEDEKNFEFLKGAAYYPYQLDPEPLQEYSFDENCLIQLAFATYYGYWTARALLVQLDRLYPNMSAHKLCLKKDIPLKNDYDDYYELALPEDFQNIDGNLLQQPFLKENDVTKTLNLFDYLLQIATTGQAPDEKLYLKE